MEHDDRLEEIYGTEVWFRVKLLLVDEHLAASAEETLRANCTYVAERLWIFEGEEYVLERAGVAFQLLDTSTVPSLDGLTEKELILVCKDRFRFDHGLLA